MASIRDRGMVVARQGELVVASITDREMVWFGLLGFNASATARVISRR